MESDVDSNFKVKVGIIARIDRLVIASLPFTWRKLVHSHINVSYLKGSDSEALSVSVET